MMYKKKPVEVQAFQMTKDMVLRVEEWPDWLYSALVGADDYIITPMRRAADDEVGVFVINTLEGDHSVKINDWIVQGVQGELYPVKPDIFEKTYEEVL